MGWACCMYGKEDKFLLALGGAFEINREF